MLKIIKKKIEKSSSVTLSTPILLLSIIIFSSIILIATAQVNGMEESATNTIEKPDADFSANVTSGNAPLTVKFTDESTESPTEWKWNFGDGSPVINGTTEDYKTPTHTYEEAGVYEVKETAINSVGRNTEKKPGYIIVNNESSENNDDSESSKSNDDFEPSKNNDDFEPITSEKPDADFSANVTSGNAPLIVKFTDESTESPTEWKWNFGDGSPVINGTTEDYKTPTHTYEEAGVYEVKETAINSVGRNTEKKPGYIIVNNESSENNDDSESSKSNDDFEPSKNNDDFKPLLSEKPDADFSADITSGSAPLTVTFTDESTGSPTELEWNFGDGSPVINGTTSEYRISTHTYEEAGVYKVKETAINSVGRNTEIKPGYITVKNKGSDDTNVSKLFQDIINKLLDKNNTDVSEPLNAKTGSTQTQIINNTTHISNSVNSPTTNTSSTNININKPTSSTNTNNPTSTDTRINSYNKESNVDSYNKGSNVNNSSEENINTSNSSINSKNESNPNSGPSNRVYVVGAVIGALGLILAAYIGISKKDR